MRRVLFHGFGGSLPKQGLATKGKAHRLFGEDPQRLRWQTGRSARPSRPEKENTARSLAARYRRAARRVTWWTTLWLAGCSLGGRSASPQLIRPATPSAESYRTAAPKGPAALGDLGLEAAAALARARSTRPAHGSDGDGSKAAPPRLSLVPDPRLSYLAQFVAEHFRAHEQTPQQLALDFVAHHLGLVEPAPHVTILDAPRWAIGAALVRELTIRGSQQDYTHVGLYAESTGILGARATVALSSRHLRMKPLPRRVPRNHVLSLRGALHPGYRSPVLVVIAPDGKSERRALGRGRRFSQTLPLSAAGIYRVELLAEGPRGLSVLANFPVYAGIDIERQRILARDDGFDSEHAGSPGAIRARLLFLLNEERRRVKGIPALQESKALSAIAAAHNHDMIKERYVGHRSPTTGSLADRLDAAGIRWAVALENIGRAYSVQELHDGWMNSPGHRSNMLHPGVTHVGLAITVTKQNNGGHELLATMILVRPMAELPRDPVRTLHHAIEQRRKDAQVSPLHLDPRLNALCQAAAARHVARSGLAPAQNIAMLYKAYKASPAEYRALKASLWVVTSLGPVAEERELLDERARSLGIGVAQGTRPDKGPRTLTVVVALAY